MTHYEATPRGKMASSNDKYKSTSEVIVPYSLICLSKLLLNNCQTTTCLTMKLEKLSLYNNIFNICGIATF